MSNAAMTFDHGRQYPLYATATIDFSNIATTATAVTVLKLPINSQIVGGSMVVDVATNAGTSFTLSVGDSTTAARYLGATSTQATGRTALVPTDYINTGGLDIQVTPAIAGAAATAGTIRLTVAYIIVGRAQEVQVN